MLARIDRRYADEVPFDCWRNYGRALEPGTTAFVCWHNYGRNTNEGYACHENYWVGVICSEMAMPASLRLSRPPRGVVFSELRKEEPKTVGEKEYPVFLPERGKFVWLPRRAIGYLCADQVDYFKLTPLYECFKMLHGMASDTINYGSEFWLNLAMEAVIEENVRKAAQGTKRQTKSGGDVCADDEASDEDQGEDDSHLEESEGEQTSRKRARTTDSPRLTRALTIPAGPLPTLPSMASPISTMTARGSTAVTTDSNPGDVIIKHEDGEDGEQMVTVYIGPQNQIFNISKEDLSQSPVLYGYIRGKPGGLSIMDPELTEVSDGDFEAVDEFLKTGEFQPTYLAKELTADIGPGAGSLDGVDTHKEDSVQVKRLAKLYLLAGRFKLPTMQLLIHQKLIAGFPRGYPYKAMLVFVGQIFQAMPGTVQDAAALPDTEGRDPLKEWLIVWLAHHMRRYSQSHTKAVPRQYWETLDKGVGLSLAVHRAKAQIIEKYKGELVKLEDDERSDAWLSGSCD